MEEMVERPRPPSSRERRKHPPLPERRPPTRPEPDREGAEAPSRPPAPEAAEAAPAETTDASLSPDAEEVAPAEPVAADGPGGSAAIEASSEAEAEARELENSLFPRSESGRHLRADGDPLIQRAASLADEFEELGVLGRGGMGVVLLARERHTGGEVALKRLQRGVEPRRILDEARTVASLDHPGIVRLHRVVATDDDEVALVLERVEGGDLESRVQQDGAPGLLEALEVCRQVGEALAYAHAHGVIHRDVKPANILMPPEGPPRLTDFGLALQPDLQSLIDTGTWVGTLDYMAPEQRLAADRVDGRADVYGLGATLYRLLTGSSPHVIREARVPDVARALVLRALEEDPADRYASMEAFLADLRRVVDRVRQDASGVTAPLERIASDFQRRLDRAARAEGVQRLAVAASGLAAMGLLPADTPRRLAVRLEMGEPWEDELERLVGLVLDAAAARPREATGLLADAHVLLTTALRGVELGEGPRRFLRRLTRASRAPARPAPATRLAEAIKRLVARGALTRPALARLAPLAASEEPPRVLEQVLEELRAAAVAAGAAEWHVAEACWRHALRDLADAFPEPELAAPIDQGQLALELESLARQPEEDEEST